MDISKLPIGTLVHITQIGLSGIRVIYFGLITNGGYDAVTNTIVLDKRDIVDITGLRFDKKRISNDLKVVYYYYEQEPDFDLGII